MRLTGKTAVVTGASRGIGLAIAAALSAEGMRVVAGARTVSAELKETGAFAVPVDLSTPKGPGLLIDQALAELGEIDVLVNNVGGGDAGGGLAGGFSSFGEDVWRQTFELNFFSAVRASRAALPSLIRRRGTIINISSNAARTPQVGPAPYTTAKAALTAFSKSLAEEFGPQGVRVNTVSPGPSRTPLLTNPDGYGGVLAKAMGVEMDELLARLPANAGMTTGRLIEPAEVAELVVYLASPRAASISGADYLIDGGASKTA